MQSDQSDQTWRSCNFLLLATAMKSLFLLLPLLINIQTVSSEVMVS